MRKDINAIVDIIKDSLIHDICEYFNYTKKYSELTQLLVDVVDIERKKFFIIIDEWDALFREVKDNYEIQKEYVNFLRSIFKNGNVTSKVIAGAYMTGILPIKKYGTQSAVSDFIEYTMTSPGEFAGYIGFIEKEVCNLCEKSGLSVDEAKKWYDGYRFEGVGSVYNPNSLMSAIKYKTFANYWGRTESYESIIPYIEMDYDGLRQDVVALIGGAEVPLDVYSYQNDMTSIRGKDDILSLLVHLGYLGYDSFRKSAYIPNEEARQEFVRAAKNSNRRELVRIIQTSDSVLKSTIAGEMDYVAKAIADIHETGVAPRFYNDEQSLRYVIRFAYLSAVDNYARIEELPSGHGYADVVYLPKKNSDFPSILIELKWNKTVDSAIEQIYDRNYPEVLKSIDRDIILVGITYDTETKQHDCKIEFIRNGSL